MSQSSSPNYIAKEYIVREYRGKRVAYGVGDLAAGRAPAIGQWEDTPRWMFWKPTKRRVRRRYPLHSVDYYDRSFYEYQHPAFVAREILENTFAPDHTTETGSN